MKKENFIVIILLIFLLMKVFLFVFNNRDVYLDLYDHKEMGRIYTNSQYVLGPKSPRPIGDDGLYAVSGYFYFLQKGDISAINFENPPLGKYLIGLSILLFKNAKVISIIYGLLLLFVMYKTSRLLFNRLISASAVFIFSLSPLFLDQLTGNLLDLPLTLFLLTGIYFYIKAKKNTDYFYLSSLFLSFSFVTKFFPGLLLIIIILFLFLLPKGKHYCFTYLKSLVVFPLIYFLSHAMYFYYHPSLMEFLKYQRWIISWRSGNPFITGNILNALFLGQYQSWWDPKLYVYYNNWNILSPLIPFLAFVSIFFKKSNTDVLLIWFLSFIFFLYVFFVTTGMEKYLLPVYPLLTILAAYTLLSVSSIIIKHGRNRLKSYQKKS